MTPEEVSNLIGKYAVILDRRTLRSVARGLVIRVKLVPVPCVSMDNVHFFSIGEDNRAECHFHNKTGYEVYDAPESPAITSFQRIPDDWKKGPWRDKFENPELVQDVYIEQDFIDPEILDLVIAINRISGVATGGSCCGHVKETAFVTLLISSFEGLNFLLRCQNAFPDEWNITTDKITSPNVSRAFISLTLRSMYKGDKVYEDIRKFTSYILQKGKEEGILVPPNVERDFFPSME